MHLLTHLSSFGIDKSLHDSFKEGVKENIVPLVTGLVVLIIFVIMGVSSIKPLRSTLRFIPFNVTHWIGAAVFYLLLLIHGVNYWNPSFWKWLLPAVIIFGLERVYRHVVMKKQKVIVKCAGKYDCVSRTAIVELDKPKLFDYEPGQYILLNFPKIGKEPASYS